MPLEPEAFADGGLDDVVFACARTKLDVVAADERDAGRRAVLNLGHTVGHAIEAASGYERYRHGEAVGLGLLAALRLSGAGRASRRGRELLARHGLPTDARSGDRHRRRARRDRARQEGDRRGRRLRPARAPGRGRARASASSRIAVARGRGGAARDLADDGLAQPGRRHARGQPRHARPPRPRASTGRSALTELETQIKRWARELGLEATFFQTNHEGEFCEYLHRLPERADAAIINAGAWTHYSLGDPRRARDRRRCPRSRSTSPTSARARTGARSRSSTAWSLEKISGEGADGYREALEILHGESSERRE